jgi:hypothetical protein
MEIGKQHGGKEIIDYLGHRKEIIKINNEG